MGEVRALPGHPIAIPDGKANQEIIAALEGLLEKAKAGQIRAIAWATYKSTDMTSAGWCSGAYGFHLGAAVMSLHNQYGRQLAGE